MVRSSSRDRRRGAGWALAALVLAGVATSAHAVSLDLSVDTPATNSPSAPTAQKITFTARVANLGTAGSPAAKVRFYRSTDATITSADTRLTTERLDPISAGRYRTVSADLTVGTALGSFWFGACVEGVPGDTNAGNDCSAGVAVQVGPRPDVAVGEVMVSPAVVPPWSSMEASAVIRSVGTGASGPGSVEFRYAAEGDPSPEWYYVQGVNIPPLAVGSSVTIRVSDDLDEYAGRYRLRACVQDVPFDGSAADDCAEGTLIVEGADLEASETAVDIATPGLGEPFVIGATIRNRGTTPSTSRGARYLFAATPDEIWWGVELGTETVPALEAGEAVRTEHTATFGAIASGYVAVCLQRSNENDLNDCSPAVRLVIAGVNLGHSTLPLRVGATNRIFGSGFTPGTVIQLYVSTPGGVVPYGPFTPTLVDDTAIDLDLPPSMTLGNGFVSLEAINTDQGYVHSAIRCTNLLGSDDQGPPSLEGLGSSGLAVADCAVPLASIHAALTPGSALEVFGRRFANPKLNLFTPAGNFGPLEPGAGWTSSHASFQIPADVPIGTATLQLVNEPYAGNVQSNAVLAVVGEAIGIDSVSQSGSQITVTGAGFSPATVINFFNWDGVTFRDLGGLTQGGAPRIPLADVSSSGFTFQRPSEAVAGKAYVQALNPPFVPATSTGNDPDGAFNLQ